MQSAGRASCSEYFDLRLSTDIIPNCSNELEKEYKDHLRSMKVNSSLQSILGEDYLEFIPKLFKVDMACFSKEIFTIEYALNSCFVEFLRRSYNDLCICWNDPCDYEHNGERTMFVEVFVQQFKLFSKITKLLQFKWVEKEASQH